MVVDRWSTGGRRWSGGQTDCRNNPAEIVPCKNKNENEKTFLLDYSACGPRRTKRTIIRNEYPPEVVDFGVDGVDNDVDITAAFVWRK